MATAITLCVIRVGYLMRMIIRTQGDVQIIIVILSAALMRNAWFVTTLNWPSRFSLPGATCRCSAKYHQTTIGGHQSSCEVDICPALVGEFNTHSFIQSLLDDRLGLLSCRFHLCLSIFFLSPYQLLFSSYLFLFFRSLFSFIYVLMYVVVRELLRVRWIDLEFCRVWADLRFHWLYTELKYNHLLVNHNQIKGVWQILTSYREWLG